MYLREVRLRDIKCFDEIKLDFSNPGGTGEDAIRKWTVILGENGLGKSSLLQSIAVPLAGPSAIRELLPVADGWVRFGRPYGEINAVLTWTDGDAQLPRWPKRTPYHANFVVTGDEPRKLPEGLQDVSTVPVIVDWQGHGGRQDREIASKEMSRLKKTAYAENQKGWFACGYGPFRRLSGGSQEADRILYARRRSARFVTLFREDAALTSATEWLVELYNTSRDGEATSARALEVVRKTFQQEFLLQPADIHVDARRAYLELAGGPKVPFHALSDGYRSMLALGIDLLRWALDAFPDTADPLQERGVVLIDELDAHLHPSWQRSIGEWLLAKFPRLQFIVVTHSPFLAQVRADGNLLLRRRKGRVVVEHGDAQVADWRVDQVFTDLFDMASVRSLSFERNLAELVRLRRRQMKAGKTAKDDKSAQERLKGLEDWLDHVPSALERPDERDLATRLRVRLSERRDELEDLA
jgi:AAA domain, putative AbiEii toxin, Type IV TA system